MGLSCGSSDVDTDGFDWWWCWPREEKSLATKRFRKCCSCGARIEPGQTCQPVYRYRPPASEIEDRIHGEEVSMANWYLCEKCGDIALSLDEAGYCFELGNGESIAAQITEYRKNSGGA